MKKLILIILAVILSNGVSSAQKLIKAFNAFHSGDTVKAQKMFKKSLKKQREIHAAYYGTGLCLEKNEPKEAFINFKKTEGKFRASGKDFKKYMLSNYQITHDSVKLKINAIAASELRRTIDYDSTEKGFEAYIRTYQGCDKKYIERAKKLQEEAAYRTARKDTTLQKARAFLKKYPKSGKRSFLEEFIDSVEYYSALNKGTSGALYKFLDKTTGNRYRVQALLLADYIEKPMIVLSDEYIKNWRKEVYYSGHWTRLKFFYERLPHLMNDSLKRMYYSGLYGEANFETNKYWNDWFNPDFLAKRDSVYDYYIQRGAPSLLAFKKMQELYGDFVYRNRLDSANAVLDKYAPLFPNFKNEIEQIRRLINEKVNYCKPVKLPPEINNEPYYKPEVKYVTVKGKKYPYLNKDFMFKDGANKFPVISPDGNKIYFTHWSYKIVRLKWSETKKWTEKKETFDTSGINIDTVCIGANIFMSEKKNGRWTEPVPVPGLSSRDSLRIKVDTIKHRDIFGKNPYTDVIIKQSVVRRDSIRIMMCGISNDNTMMVVNSPKKLQWGPPDNDGTVRYYQNGVVCYSLLINGKWSSPTLCGNLNHYTGSFAVTSPNPFFGSFDAHISPDNNVIFFAAARRGVAAWREGFTIAKYQQPYPEFFQPKYAPVQEHYYPNLYFSVKDKDGQWSYPQTMGETLNTEYSEMCPVLAADNKTLYFISEGHYGLGGTDIYMCKRLNENSWSEWTAPINLGKYINTPYNEYNFSITADGKTACFASEDPVTHRLTYYTVNLPKGLRPDTIAIYKGTIKNLSGEPLSARIRVEDLKNDKVYANYHTQMPSGEFYFGLPQDRSYKFTITAKNCISEFETLDFEPTAPVVEVRNFVLVDSACVFEKRISVSFETTDVKRYAAFLKNYEFPCLEITVTGFDKKAAESTAANIASSFSANGIDKEKIIIVTKTGKPKNEFRIIDME
ncbi:MAG: PD40 domain-containing protein [Bacteroidales bacterium]|nr:PD40 domain-containing protein [Bacteroidales bacterium]